MARASRRRFHYIYKITNKLNGKFYIGMHSTDNLDDGYFGSGKLLRRSIEKHGKENHEMEILEHYFSRADLAAREKELVNKDFLANESSLNLCLGGDGGGGWDRVNSQPRGFSHQSKASINGWQTKQNDLEFMEKFSTLHSIKMKECHENGKITPPSWVGKKHSEETLIKMRESHKGLQDGEKNSQFGTSWITNGSEVKKVKNDELQLWLNSGWRKGRRKE